LRQGADEGAHRRSMPRCDSRSFPPRHDAVRRTGTYKEDVAAAWAYASALLGFRSEGDSERARRLLRDAMKTNRHVPAMLLLKKKPKRLPEFIGLGDKSEAVAYVAENLGCWKHTPGALEWLAQRV
jgi:hypothetical protein